MMMPADRHDVREPERAERQEQRQRGLGAVRGRGERVEAEHRDARERTDLLLVLLGRREAAPEDQVGKRSLPRANRGAVADHGHDLRSDPYRRVTAGGIAHGADAFSERNIHVTPESSGGECERD